MKVWLAFVQVFQLSRRVSSERNDVRPLWQKEWCSFYSSPSSPSSSTSPHHNYPRTKRSQKPNFIYSSNFLIFSSFLLIDYRKIPFIFKSDIWPLTLYWATVKLFQNLTFNVFKRLQLVYSEFLENCLWGRVLLENFLKDSISVENMEKECVKRYRVKNANQRWVVFGRYIVTSPLRLKLYLVDFFGAGIILHFQKWGWRQINRRRRR